MPDPIPDFRLTLLARDLAIVRAADEAGVQVIGLDLEQLGKTARQGHVADARVSDHDFDDLRVVTGAIRRATPFVRLNPLHAGTSAEIERALACGARAVMLPYFRAPDEAAAFVRLVAGRARVSLLVETGAALARLHRILAIEGVDEIMIGLNDLHLDLGLDSPFEILGSELFAAAAAQVRRAGLRFGFGGVTCPDDADLPVPPDLVLAQYARLGASAAWIARSFLRGGAGAATVAPRLAALRTRLAWWFAQPPAVLDEARRELERTLERLRRAR
jgi:hypothetical protein